MTHVVKFSPSSVVWPTYLYCPIRLPSYDKHSLYCPVLLPSYDKHSLYCPIRLPSYDKHSLYCSVPFPFYGSHCTIQWTKSYCSVQFTSSDPLYLEVQSLLHLMTYATVLSNPTSMLWTTPPVQFNKPTSILRSKLYVQFISIFHFTTHTTCTLNLTSILWPTLRALLISLPSYDPHYLHS